MANNAKYFSLLCFHGCCDHCDIAMNSQTKVILAWKDVSPRSPSPSLSPLLAVSISIIHVYSTTTAQAYIQ